MIKNYFKIAWRTIKKDKQFSFLNLVGLSTGLACVLLIYLWVTDELNVDKFNDKGNRIYQVMKNAPNATGGVDTYESSQGMLAGSMAADLPEVELAVRVRPQDAGVLTAGNKNIKVKSQFVDKDFFNVFSYGIKGGSAKAFFSDKNAVMISDKLALKLFDSEVNVVGKPVSWDRGEFTGPYYIAGIFNAPPANATNQFDMLFNFKQYETKESEDLAFWGSNNVNTFLLLKKGTGITAFNDKIKDYTRHKIKKLYPDDKGLLSWEGTVFAQLYSDRYLHDHYENGAIAGGRIEYVRLFSIIAIFILLIACINFMNLSTAKASKRIKEVGIKKVVGASRASLVWQYMIESLLMTFFSLLIAMFLAILLLPAFRQLTGKEISIHLNYTLVFSTLAITIITGLLAGSYPALYLSRFRPALVLKGKLRTSVGESWIRKGLVILQFAISVILIVSVMVVYQQMKLIQTKNLGYDKENVISFVNDDYLQKNLLPFIAEIKKIPGVVNASGMNGDFFGNASHGGSGIDWEGKNPALGIEYYGNDVGYNFFETMNLPMESGRVFSPEFSDSSSVIFNQSAINAMGLKDPIGKTVSLWGKKKQIVGIVKDYHFQSMYKKISPAFMTWSANNESTIVKIKAGHTQQTIADIGNMFKKFNHNLEFSYSFIDETYNKLYASEQRVASLSKYFACIAILISCLGLFGLATFTAQKRRKEIGIRKVVGASAGNVAALLSGDFLKLAMIACLIAMPFSWWAANKWLQSFAYRIHISSVIFILTGLSIFVITLITISFQTIKAAIANPVKNLRTE